MIPKVIKDGPNMPSRYVCSVCSAPLKKTDPFTGAPSGWKFCCICGNPIEWEKAGPPVLTELTVLVTFEDGGTETERFVGNMETLPYWFPVGETPRRGSGADTQDVVIAKVEIVNVREFTQEDGHAEL